MNVINQYQSMNAGNRLKDSNIPSIDNNDMGIAKKSYILRDDVKVILQQP